VLAHQFIALDLLEKPRTLLFEDGDEVLLLGQDPQNDPLGNGRGMDARGVGEDDVPLRKAAVRMWSTPAEPVWIQRMGNSRMSSSLRATETHQRKRIEQPLASASGLPSLS
jgi:hypothetical protein